MAFPERSVRQQPLHTHGISRAERPSAAALCGVFSQAERPPAASLSTVHFPERSVVHRQTPTTETSAVEGPVAPSEPKTTTPTDAGTNAPTFKRFNVLTFQRENGKTGEREHWKTGELDNRETRRFPQPPRPSWATVITTFPFLCPRSTYL